MKTLTVSDTRANLNRLIDETAASYTPIVIAGKRNFAVLVSQEAWSAIQETLFLLATPGMRESIQAGLATPVRECAPGLDW
jgi:prevent-host-death family protein